MSFICGVCKKLQPPGTEPEKVLLQERIIEDEVRMISSRAAEYFIKRKEIAKEVDACPKCAANPPKVELLPKL